MKNASEFTSLNLEGYMWAQLCVCWELEENVCNKLNNAGKDITLDHIFDEETIKCSWLQL